MNDLTVRRSFLRAACFALALAPLAGWAQLAPASGEKPLVVRSIRVRAEGGQASESFVLGHVALRAGEAFTRDAVASTVRSLYATGRFNQALVVPELDPKTGQVDLLIIVEPRPLLREIVKGGRVDLIDLDSLQQPVLVELRHGQQLRLVAGGSREFGLVRLPHRWEAP